MSKVTPVEILQNQRFCEVLEPKLQHFLSRQPAVHLLEVGCGRGALAFILQEKYKEKVIYKAIDPSKEAIEKAKERGVQGVEAISLDDLQSPENTFDVVLCTKSFHHLPSLPKALEKIHKVLKPEGLFLADEFAREAMDVTTAKFLYEKMDTMEEAGKLAPHSKWPTNPDIKHDYLKRWQIKYLPKEHGSHGAHAGHTHAHPHAEHAHTHLPGERAVSETQAHGPHAGHGTHEAHGAPGHKPHDAHAAHGSHGAHAAHGHHHHHTLPTSEEMISEIKKVFPNLEVAPCAFLYNFIAQRFDGLTTGEEIVKEFRTEEQELISKKQIVAIGLRFTCTK